MMKYKIYFYNILIIINLFDHINGHLELDEGSRCHTDDKVGFCKKLPECQSMVDLLETTKIRFKDIVICSYIGSTSVVCCLDESPIDNEVITKRPVINNPNGIIFPREPKFVSRFQNHQIRKTNSNKTTVANTKPLKTIRINNITITDKTEYIDLTNLLNNWPKNQIEISLSSSKTNFELTNKDKTNLNNRTAERKADAKVESFTEINGDNNIEAINNENKNNANVNLDYSDIFQTNGNFLVANVEKTDERADGSSFQIKNNLDLNINNKLVALDSEINSKNSDKWVWESTVRSTTESPYAASDNSDPWEPYKFRPAPENETKLTDAFKVDESAKIVSRPIRNPQVSNWRQNRQHGGGMRTVMVAVPSDNFYPQSNMYPNHWNQPGDWSHQHPSGGFGNHHNHGEMFYPSREGHFGQLNSNLDRVVEPNRGQFWSNSRGEITVVEENLETASSDNEFRINKNNPWLSKITSTSKRPDIIFPSDDNARQTTPRPSSKPVLDNWMREALESTIVSTTKATTRAELDPWIKDALESTLKTTTTTETDPFVLYQPNFPSTIKPPATSTLEPWIKDAIKSALSTTTTTTTTTQKPRNDYIDLNRIIKGLPNINASPSVNSSPTNANSMQNPSLSGVLKPNIRSLRRQSETGNRGGENKPTTRPTKRPTTGPVSRKSIQACQKYRTLKLPVLDFQILDGLPVEEGEFPNMVALGYPSSGFGRDYEWNCGGSLISERYVLTAAHCFIRNEPTIVRMGKRTLDTDEDKQTITDVPVSNITVHPEYSSFMKYHDIALIRLANDVEFDPTHVLPACLYEKTTDLPETTELWATGWGVVNTTTRSRSSILLKVNLTSYDLNTCNKSHIDFGVNREYPTGLDNGQLCAGDPTGKKDTCQGDSGGPLQVLEGSNRMPMLVGITSFGASCGTTVPSVYSRIGYYLDWIESVAWP